MEQSLLKVTVESFFVMLMFAIFSILSVSKSSTDCFPSSDSSWSISYDSTEPFCMSDGDNISYISARHRKKWQLMVSGSFSNATFLFEDASTGVFHIDIVSKSPESVTVTGTMNSKVLASKEISTSTPHRFVVLSGRGCVSFLVQRENEDMPHDSLVFTDTSIPRTARFVLLSHGTSEVYRLCMGDFIGPQRPILGITNWDRQMHDL